RYRGHARRARRPGSLRCSRRRRTCRQCRSSRRWARAPAASGEAAREHGARSPSGHRRPGWCLASPLFPCSSLAALPRGAAPRAEKPAVLVDFLAGARTPLFEARGLPHLEFRAETHESDVGRKAGVGAKPFRKHDASVLIDGDDVHVTIERDRQLVALVRIIRQAVEKPVDLARKALAACIERRSIERGVAVDAAGGALRVAVALEHGAEGGWDRDPALGVDLVRECRDKAVHPVELDPRLHTDPNFWPLRGLHSSKRSPWAFMG